MRTKLTLVLTVAIGLLLAACGGTTNTATGPQPTSTPEVDGAISPEPTPTTTADNEGKSLFDAAVLRYLVGETGVGESEITLLNRSEQVWPNSALGCPEEGKMYLDVLTPGFLIEATVAGEPIEIHTNEDASQMVLCDKSDLGDLDGESGALVSPTDPTPRPATPVAGGEDDLEDEMADDGATQPAGDPGTTSLADQVIRFVAAETGLSPATLTIESDEAVVWRDSALGCPEQGQMYMQVLTAGRRYVVSGADERLLVHTDQSGSRMVLCPSERAQSPAPGQSSDQ